MRHASPRQTRHRYDALITGVAADANGIGYAGIEMAKAAGAKTVTIDGVEATAAAVHSGKYITPGHCALYQQSQRIAGDEGFHPVCAVGARSGYHPPTRFPRNLDRLGKHATKLGNQLTRSATTLALRQSLGHSLIVKSSSTKLFRLALGVGLLALHISRAADWPMYRGGPDLNGLAAGSLPTKPVLLWSFKTHGPVKSSAAIAGNRVFVGSAITIFTRSISPAAIAVGVHQS